MSGRHDAYGGFARHYDLHGWDWYARTNGERLIDLLKEHGAGPGASVLDAGCGTGSLGLMLSQAGYRVTGVDLSAAMIARAQKKDTSGAVDWRVADLTALDLGTTFDAIVSVADVFNHLPTIAEWDAALSGFHRHLRKGGLAFVDAMTCRGLEKMDVQAVEHHGLVTLILAIVYEPDARRSTLKLTSFAPASSSPEHYEREQRTITEWGQGFEDALGAFTRAGFSGTQRVWGEDPSPEADDRMSFLARPSD